MEEISERYIQAFHEDMDALGILKPDQMPRATKCLDSILTLIKELEAKGMAYSIDGDVYFSVMKHSGYGKLSKRDLNEQQLNADGRISQEESFKKKSAYDFALWKQAKKGEPSYQSPWGYGRPGWHIECSAMVREVLGNTIDIHLGGADLIFPHHENEIAQSEAATNKELARYWLHNGMVNVNGQKMSKSLSNFTTIRALLEDGVSPMTLRLFILQAHYRKPLDFTGDALKAAAAGWKRLNKALCVGNIFQDFLEWPEVSSSNQNQGAIKNSELPFDNRTTEICKEFTTAMDDDMNTSAALAFLFDLARPLHSLATKINQGELDKLQGRESENLYKQWKTLVHFSGVLGFFAETTKSPSDIPLENYIKEAIARRKEAKRLRDYGKADKIRQDLKEQGIDLIDKSDGETSWVRI